jgi:hypothetical protein
MGIVTTVGQASMRTEGDSIFLVTRDASALRRLKVGDFVHGSPSDSVSSGSPSNEPMTPAWRNEPMPRVLLTVIGPILVVAGVGFLLARLRLEHGRYKGPVDGTAGLSPAAHARRHSRWNRRNGQETHSAGSSLSNASAAGRCFSRHARGRVGDVICSTA